MDSWKGDPVKLVPAYILRSSKHAPTDLAYPLSLHKIYCFNQQFCCFCSKLSQFFVAICFPNPCWTWISAPSACTFLFFVFTDLNFSIFLRWKCQQWNVSASSASTQSSYLCCSWSAPNKKFVFLSMNKIISCLTDLLHQDSLNGSEKHRATPLFTHACYAQRPQRCADARPC
jgi:hypothetical protein